MLSTLTPALEFSCPDAASGNCTLAARGLADAWGMDSIKLKGCNATECIWPDTTPPGGPPAAGPMRRGGGGSMPAHGMLSRLAHGLAPLPPPPAPRCLRPASALTDCCTGRSSCPLRCSLQPRPTPLWTLRLCWPSSPPSPTAPRHWLIGPTAPTPASGRGSSARRARWPSCEPLPPT